jgi:hypothetical protein
MSNDGNTYKFIFYLTAAGTSLMVYSYKQIKKKTKMQINAKQLMASASAGNVEIEGVIWPFRSIDTSLDGKKIVFRHIEVQKYVKRGKSSSWDTMWENVTAGPFLIFDQTGFMLVNTSNNEKFGTLTEGITSRVYNPEKLSADQLESFEGFFDNSISGFKAKLKGESTILGQLLSMQSYRIKEKYIAIGSPMLLHGHFNPEDTFRFVNIASDYKLFKERACKLLINKSYQLSIFDKNKDGEVDLKELYNGFHSALVNSVKKDFTITDIRPDGPANEKLYGTLVGTAENELLISEGFETQILKNSPIYRNWLCLYLGAAIVGCSIIFFIILN